MTSVRRWTGQEIRALRAAHRMSIRDFASHLGVSERVVSKWEAGGGTIEPRPVNQAALDTSLTHASGEVRARFEASVIGSLAPAGFLPEIADTADDSGLMAVVDGGLYLAGPDNKRRWLPTFHIDVYPTTNAEYSRFVEATGHTPPPHWPNGQFPQKLANHPVVHVTWHDANQYAQWAGKALPTAAQWEKAARGRHGDTYPWGSQQTPAKCNVSECGIGSTTRVDRYLTGASPYDVYDMCGNVWEWCSSETTPGRYVLKGGAFTSPFSRATPADFNDADATMSDNNTGFRCIAMESP